MQDAPHPSPPGTLAIVATPIGNLRDITLRALDVLRMADVIAAEDTRNSQHLLSAYGIQARLVTVHEHNEAAAAGRVIEDLRAGKRVAYISDAGTPGLSDPGARLVEAVRAAGLPVMPVPGASALAAAVSVSGLEGGFLFQGFLPPKAAARRRVLEDLRDVGTALVFYEAPHRIEETVVDLAAVLGGGRTVLFAREISKRFEQFHACPLAEASAWLAADDNHRRGEFVLVVGPPAKKAEEVDGEGRRVLEILLAELPLKQAAHLAAKLTGGRKNELYELALNLKKETER
jgi:16S rRNA (cytidine1402-2'-O)-methyltransferase